MRGLFTVILIFSAPVVWSNARVDLRNQTAAAAADRLREQSAQVDRLMASWFAGDSPGAAVMVIQDGRVLHGKGYGMANRETKVAFGLTTPSLIGSMAKQFTAMAVMMLAEQGRLRYDDSVATYLPGFSGAYEAITIRHLSHHTSGLPPFEDLLHKRMKIDFASGKRRGGEASAAEVLQAYARQQEPRFKPGERYEYNNGGYVVLTHIVEKAAGMSYRSFVREKIFTPLGVGDSFFAEESGPQMASRAIGYFREWHGIKVSDYLAVLKFYNGAAGIFTTAEDLYKWDQALYTERLIRAATFGEALRPGRLSDGRPLNYGFGWELFRSKETPYMLHAGGWGGFKSFIVRIPEQRFAIIALSNSGQFDQLKATQEIARIYLGGYLGGIPAPR